MRTFVIGDVHGCLEELHQLVTISGYRKGLDRLIFLGDLVDRGPYPVETVRCVRKMGWEVVASNHEQKVVDFRSKEAIESSGGPKNKMRRPHADRLAQWMEFTDEELEWMKGLPLWLEISGPKGKFLAVHAGFEPKPLQEQDPEKITRVKWVHKDTGDFVGMKKVRVEDPAIHRSSKTHSSGNRTLTPEALALRAQRQNARMARGLDPIAVQESKKRYKYHTTFEQPDNTVSWQSVWPGPSSVVYGHDAQKSGNIRIDKRAGYKCIGIDTACVYGKNLTCAIFEDGQFVDSIQVQAKKIYYHDDNLSPE